MRTAWSDLRGSRRIDPTTAIAPTHTVSEAWTNPPTKPPSPSLWEIFLSHAPKRSIAASMLMISPMSAPSTRLAISVIVPPLERVPSAAALSIFSIAPAIPRNITHTPARHRERFLYARLHELSAQQAEKSARGYRCGVYYSAKSRQSHRPQEKFGITASLFAGLY